MPTQIRARDNTLILTIAISALAINAIIPAIPQTQLMLGGRIMDGHFITTIYLLGYCLGHIPFGMLADRFGRKITLLSGLALFVLGGVASGLSTNMELMLWARFVQGIGGAVGPVIVRAIARDIASGQSLTTLMAKLMNALAFMPLIAPFIGSGALWAMGWRGPYIFSCLIGGLSFICVAIYVPETRKIESKSHIPFFLLRQSFRLFVSKGESLWGTALIVSIFFGYLAMITSIASILHDVYGVKGHLIGWFVGALAIPYAASATFNRIASRGKSIKVKFFNTPRSARYLLGLSVYFFTASAVIFAYLLFFSRPTPPLVLLFLAIVLYVIGMGMAFTNATVIAMSGQEKTAGFAAGIMGTLQIGAGFTGSWLSGIFYDQTSTSLLYVLLVASLCFILIYLIGLALKV